MKIDSLVLNPHQARTREPSAYENLLGDAMERAFADGAWELDALVAHINSAGVRDTHQQSWTAESLQEELKRLSKG